MEREREREREGREGWRVKNDGRKREGRMERTEEREGMMERE